MKKICVFGASSNQIAPVYTDAARDLGKAIAERGWGLVFGAGASGVMGATAEGVNALEGYIVGIVPSFFKELKHPLHEPVTEMIFTDTMRERKGKMEDIADAFIIAPGGIGTYEEFFEVLTLKQLSQLDKPICIFNVNHYYDPMITLLDQTVKEHFMSESCLQLCMISTSIDEMLDYIQNYGKDKVKVDFLLDKQNHPDSH